VNRDRAVERIPHREMKTENENARQLMDSTLGGKAGGTPGSWQQNYPEERQKIKVPPGKSYTEPIEEEGEDEDKDEELPILDLEDLQEEEEVVVRARKSLSQMKKHRVVVETSDEELPDLEEEEEVALRARKSLPKLKRMVAGSDEELLDVDDPIEGSSKDFQPLNQYLVGSFVVAVYEKAWYIAQVEGEDPDQESDGFTLLKYMSCIGHSQFVWGNHVDHLKTNNSDILLKVELPVPISSRFFGLPKEILKKVDKLFLVMWSIIFTFILSFSRWGLDQHLPAQATVLVHIWPRKG
jgi:hypothetical protein